MHNALFRSSTVARQRLRSPRMQRGFVVLMQPGHGVSFQLNSDPMPAPHVASLCMRLEVSH
jgi:hypothetical protein